MKIKFRIVSGEDEDFYREIEIGGNATFLDLHNYIQNLLNFDDGQMASFFMTDQEWQKNKEITLMDMAFDESGNSHVMSESTIKEFVSEKKQRLLYVFDFFNERSLFIETFEIDEKADCEKPHCTRSSGDAPKQVDISDVLGETPNPLEQLDTEYHKDDLLGYNDGEFDSDIDFKDDSLVSYTDDLDDF